MIKNVVLLIINYILRTNFSFTNDKSLSLLGYILSMYTNVSLPVNVVYMYITEGITSLNINSTDNVELTFV